MTFNEPVRKYILSGIVAFILVGLIVANVMASKQDEKFAAKEALYNQAAQLQAEGKFEDAWEAISKVLKGEPNSEIANYLAAIIAANKGDLKQATIYMQKTLDINPHKVEDPMFMIQLGELFVAVERYDDAKTVLLRCQEWGWAPEEMPNYQEHVATLLAQSENLQ
ncbi:M48 family metallopeptidase [Lysinibacillus sp. Ag94]|uniref:tetratricopeptide repeat protein n=1 Tax=Lysinibacillus sp. Ag94 TaxID=2936682 RepID=UPI00200E7330|nr:tetratricopeptide repeat protein [Lysinibacillus sp. Ag94]UPW83701.1 tetratricopeptide repeat protein [Lysinibacillus sp. Ag94]